MDEERMTELLQSAIEEFWPDHREDDNDQSEPMPAQVVTFSEAGVLANNSGLVIKMDDGSEYQITVVKSR